MPASASLPELAKLGMLTPGVQELAADLSVRVASLTPSSFRAKVQPQTITEGNSKVSIRHANGDFTFSADRLFQETACPWPPARTKVNLLVLGELLQKPFLLQALQMSRPRALQARPGGGVARHPIVSSDLAVCPLSHVVFRAPYLFAY